MQGSFLRFYVRGRTSATGTAWHGNSCSSRPMRSGSAAGLGLQAPMAGFGRHHVLHESTFFELAGTLTIEVEFIVSDAEAQKLLALLHQEGIRLFYACVPALFGVINPDPDDPPDKDGANHEDRSSATCARACAAARRPRR